MIKLSTKSQLIFFLALPFLYVKCKIISVFLPQRLKIYSHCNLLSSSLSMKSKFSSNLHPNLNNFLPKVIMPSNLSKKKKKKKKRKGKEIDLEKRRMTWIFVFILFCILYFFLMRLYQVG